MNNQAYAPGQIMYFGDQLVDQLLRGQKVDLKLAGTISLVVQNERSVEQPKLYKLNPQQQGFYQDYQVNLSQVQPEPSTQQQATQNVPTVQVQQQPVIQQSIIEESHINNQLPQRIESQNLTYLNQQITYQVSPSQNNPTNLNQTLVNNQNNPNQQQIHQSQQPKISQRQPYQFLQNKDPNLSFQHTEQIESNIPMQDILANSRPPVIVIPEQMPQKNNQKSIYLQNLICLSSFYEVLLLVCLILQYAGCQSYQAANLWISIQVFMLTAAGLLYPIWVFENHTNRLIAFFAHSFFLVLSYILEIAAFALAAKYPTQFSEDYSGECFMYTDEIDQQYGYTVKYTNAIQYCLLILYLIQFIYSTYFLYQIGKKDFELYKVLKSAKVGPQQ